MLLKHKDGNTALMIASMAGHEKVVELLHRIPGIDVNIGRLLKLVNGKSLYILFSMIHCTSTSYKRQTRVKLAQ
jgi:ankyrin repeat protein